MHKNEASKSAKYAYFPTYSVHTLGKRSKVCQLASLRRY